MSLPNRIVTLTLQAAETAVRFSASWTAFAVRNDGESDVYIAAKPGETAGNADTLLVPAGGSAVFYLGYSSDTCCILGETGGKVTVIGQNSNVNPFKVTAEGGDIPPVPAIDYIQNGLAAEWEFEKNTLEKISNTYTDSSDGPQTLQYSESLTRHAGCIYTGRFATFSPNVLPDDFDFSNFTIQTLINGAISNSYQLCFGFATSSGNDRSFCIGVAATTGQFLVEHFGGNSASNAFIHDDKWHMLTASYDGTTVRMYCNGVKAGENAKNLYLSDTEYIYVGHWSNPNLNMNYGSFIANCCIYSRVLTDSEALSNWNVDVQRYGIGEGD